MVLGEMTGEEKQTVDTLKDNDCTGYTAKKGETEGQNRRVWPPIRRSFDAWAAEKIFKP